MIHFTLICRLQDGLPLASSVDDATVEDAYTPQRRLAKMVFKSAALQQLGNVRGTLTTESHRGSSGGSVTFHYALHEPVGFLVMCDSSFSRMLAFSYLAELQTAFASFARKAQVEEAVRPYSFIRFESDITKLTKRYLHTRSLRLDQESLASLSATVQNLPILPIDNVLPGQSMTQRLPASDASSGLAPSAAVASGRFRHLVDTIRWMYDHQGRLELMLYALWLYIVFWNFIFDLWFGLGWLSVLKTESDSTRAWSTMRTPEETADSSVSLMRVISFAYGLSGLWLVRELYRLVRGPGRSQPPIMEPLPVFAHLVLTSLFLMKVLLDRHELHGYLLKRQKGHDQLWGLFIYWIYLLVGIVWWWRGSSLSFKRQLQDERKTL